MILVLVMMVEVMMIEVLVVTVLMAATFARADSSYSKCAKVYKNIPESSRPEAAREPHGS